MNSYEVVSAIKARMKEKKVTHAQMAEGMNISKKTLNSWLNFRIRMPMDYAFIMLHELGLDAQIIIKEGGQNE